MFDTRAPREGRFSLVFAGLGSLFFVASWLAPNHYPPWTSFHNEAAGFVALIAFCIASLGNGKSVPVPKTTCAFFLGLMLVVWLQTASGQIMFAGDALVSSLFLGGALLAWWLGGRAVLASDEPDSALVWASILFVVSAMCSAYLAILQWLGMEASLGTLAVERGPNMRPFANLAQPNLLATLVVMATVFSYLLYLRKLIKGWQVFALVFFLSVALVATESRAGLASAFCVGLFFILRSRRAWGMGDWRVVGVWWGLLIVLTSIWAPINQALLLQPAREAVIGVDGVRLTIWKQMAGAIAQSPWWGYGWRQTMVAQKAGAETAPGNWTLDYGHSVVLDVLAWVGLPLGLVVLVLVGWWIGRTIRNLGSATEFLLFAATIPFFVHSLVEFPFAYAFFLFPIAWILGNLQARHMPDNLHVAGATVHGYKKYWTYGGILSFALLCGQVAIEYLEAEEDCRVMRFELRRLGARPIAYEAPQLVLLTQLDEMLKMGRMKPRRGMSAADIERMRKANASLGWGTLHLNYAIALGLNGHPEEATRQLRILRAIYGADTYKQAAEEFVRTRDDKFPELAAVQVQ